jgi:hypothetical protein
VCHDGEQAFAARQNCDRCHVEPEVPLVERYRRRYHRRSDARSCERTSNAQAIWYQYAT